MYVVFLAGTIASGKSSVAKMLEKKGFLRIDLDQISRDVLAPFAPCTLDVAGVFGLDLIDPITQELDRKKLAERVFSDRAETQRLEDIELPYIKQRLTQILTQECCAATFPKYCVVEVPLLDRIEDLFDLADQIVCVCTPFSLRCQRAIERGMDKQDFIERLSLQPDDEYLVSRSDYVIDNSGDLSELEQQVNKWFETVKVNN